MSIKFEKISESNFADFKCLMCTDDIAKQCFCFNHRVEPKDLELEEVAAAKMGQLVSRRKVHGLIALEDGQPIAWVGIEPWPSLIGHDCFEMLLDNEKFGPYGEETWGIHCMFVRESHRGQKLSSILVKQAIQYAVDRGAEKILAFPPPTKVAARMHASEKFSGTIGLFQEHGFQDLGLLSAHYLLYELKGITQAPRLKLL